jgi:putative ubiquitin-RnfH superfamily antitoxin RatB of RatAB toxin-antitoxin module
MQPLRVVLVACTAPRQTQQWQLSLPQGATVADALKACGQGAALSIGCEESRGLIGVWGRSAAPETVLQDLDRVELYRPLKVDPKVARRERFAKQGARSTGLFASKRPGAKAGY